MDEQVLFTGATGFLGRRLLAELLDRLPTARFALLVRDSPEAPAQRRIGRILRSLPGPEARVVTAVEMASCGRSSCSPMPG